MTRIEQFTETVVVTKYRTSDGRVHDDIGVANDHQMRIDGDRITCPECGGTGGENWWGEDGRSTKRFIKCAKCVGKGYLDKVIIFK